MKLQSHGRYDYSAIAERKEHRERVWLTRAGDICRYVESHPAGIIP